MKELTRTQMAVVKRTAQNVKGLRVKLNKLVDKIASLNTEVVMLQSTIDKFEAPIVEMTGGFTSEEVLNGRMEATIEAFENEENVKNEVENTQENVNEAPAASDEIPYI
jgi:gas vesicle protein